GHDVAFDRSFLPDVHLLGRGEVTRHAPQHDDRFGDDFRRYVPIRSDRQHMVSQIDVAFDPTLDREILIAAQLPFDDDTSPDPGRCVFQSRQFPSRPIDLAAGHSWLERGGHGAGPTRRAWRVLSLLPHWVTSSMPPVRNSRALLAPGQKATRSSRVGGP